MRHIMFRSRIAIYHTIFIILAIVAYFLPTIRDIQNAKLLLYAFKMTKSVTLSIKRFCIIAICEKFIRDLFIHISFIHLCWFGIWRCFYESMKKATRCSLLADKMLGRQQRHVLPRRQLQQQRLSNSTQREPGRHGNSDSDDGEWTKNEPRPSDCLVGGQAYINAFRCIELNKKVSTSFQLFISEINI